MTLNFEDPKNDEATIRHHAYLRGQFDNVKMLLEDEWPDIGEREPVEEAE